MMMKLSVILFVIVFSFVPIFSQSEVWKEVHVPKPAGSVYSFVDFADTLHGVLCSTDGLLTLTANGGKSWTPLQQVPSAGTVRKIKMADTGTIFLYVIPPMGNTHIVRWGIAAAAWDSLQLPSPFFWAEAVSILNKNMIGYINRKGTIQNFVSTKDFGTSWDTLAVEVHLGVSPSVEAVDSMTIFFGGSSGGFYGGGSLYRSDDKGKTLVSLFEASAFSTVKMKIYSKEFACFRLGFYDDLRGWSGVLLHNVPNKNSATVGSYNFDGEGTIFNDSSIIAISSGSHLVPRDNSTFALIDGALSSDSLKYSTIAIAGKKSVWDLTQEGRLFTNTDNPTVASGYFPLQIGNLWQYRSADPFNPTTRQAKIVGDTLMPNSKRYAVMSGSNLGTPYLRQEASRVYGYDIIDSAEYVLLDFTANANDTLSSHSKGKWTNIAAGKQTYPGTNTSYWRFFQRMNTGLSGYIFLDWIIKDSLGLTSWVEEPGAQFNFSGAIVDGRTIGTITGIRENADKIPTVFSLSQNYPNPFNPSTMISFSLPSRSFVSLKIFDVMGRVVATIVSENLPAGSYQRQWNASGFSSGIYFYRIQAASFTEIKRLVLLR
jgi:hypothetical protein